MLKACKPFKLESQNASSSDLVSKTLPKAFRIDMARIGVSKLAAIIGRSMPERYPQENLERAQNLLNGSAEDFMREYVSMTIYNVSNNALDLEQYDKWEQTMKVLEDCNIFRLEVKHGEHQSPTVDGFMEKLFNASIHRCLPTQFQDSGGTRAETAVKWIIASGYCPNTAAKALWSRLQDIRVGLFGIQQLVLDLTERLLNAGISANILIQNLGTSHTIREIALQRLWDSDKVFNLAALLFKHGASLNLNRALRFAIERQEEDLVEMIVRYGGDLTADLKSLPTSVLHTETALTVAASIGLEQTSHILYLLCLRYPFDPLTTFIIPDVLIAAATKGHDDIIHSLYNKTSPTIVANEYGITPLPMAARYGHLSTCQVLLRFKEDTLVTARFFPLHAACYGGDKEVVEFLIQKGADVNATPGFDSYAEELLFTNRLNMPYCRSRIAPLNLLLDEARLLQLVDLRLSNLLCCATMFIRAGAKLVGDELSIAGKYCHLELLAAGIAAGANPNELDSDGKTALQCALQGDPNQFVRLYDVVTQLLSNGAQLLGGEVDNAFGLRQYEVVMLLMEHGGPMMETSFKESVKEELENAILVRNHALVGIIFETWPSIYSAGALYAAIATGNSSLIQSLMQNRPAQASKDPFEVTAIAVAAISGNLVLLQELLAHPPSCYAGPLPLGFNGNTHHICDGCSLGCSDGMAHIYNTIGSRFNDDITHDYKMCSLIEDIRSGEYQRFGELDLRSASGGRFYGSPLAPVASSMRSDALEASSYLLGSGFCTDKLTWVAAASFNNTKFVQTLLNHNQHSNYSYREFKGWSPLACAIQHRNKELVALLFNAGVDVNGRGSSAGEPLRVAVAKGDSDIVDYLFKAGADINADDRLHNVYSPLQTAVEKGKLDIVDYLLRAKATVNANSRSSSGPSPLQIAVDKGRLDILDSLLRAGADVNPNNISWGQTPLQIAVNKGRLEIVKFLLQAGADVNPNHISCGQPPLQIATKHGKMDIVYCLVQAGANINSPATKERGGTPLQFAAINGYLGLAKYLIDKGTKVNAPPSRHHGRTALQGAAEHGRLDMLEFLLTEGALTTGRWRRRFIKAVKLAMKERHFIAADYLKKSAGWSEEDENLLPKVDEDFDTDSEGDELHDVATDDATDSSDHLKQSAGGSEEDESLLPRLNVDFDTYSERDELAADTMVRGETEFDWLIQCREMNMMST